MEGVSRFMIPLCNRDKRNPGDTIPEHDTNTLSMDGESHGSVKDAEYGYHNQRFALANDISQSHLPNVGFDSEGAAAHDLQSCVQKPQLTASGNDSLLLSTKNFMAIMNPDLYNPEQRDLFPHKHMLHRKSFSIEEPILSSMAPAQLSESRHSSAPPNMPFQRYGPFLGRFRTSEEAKFYRRERMRFDRRPWRDPETDPTIAETENNRDYHVERIYNAMISGEFARDNAKSTALKRWVQEPHYQADLVEAYAHKVFDCLLEQVKHGFRGWYQNDYVNDERKGEDDDKDIDCAGRLDNIVTALQQEKSICENVMSSAWQIRMFVNAPKAYAKRKDQNRVGNSKRPNAKSTETAENGPRALKRARNTASALPRNTALARTRQARDGASISQLQQQYQRTESPYFTSPVTQSTEVSPSERFMSMTEPNRHFSHRSQGFSAGHEIGVGLSPATTLQAQPFQTSEQQKTQHMMTMATMPHDNVFVSNIAEEAKSATAHEQQDTVPFPACQENSSYDDLFNWSWLQG